MLSACGDEPQPATTTVSSFLRDFENGRWLEQEAPQLASSINELGWVQDGIDGTESEAIQNLLYVAVVSRPVASSIISLGWVQDGIDDAESGAIHWMRNIGAAEVASSVVALSWVQDRIEAVEVKTIEELSYISNRDAEVASSIISLGWVQDGIDDAESGAIHWMRNIGAAEVASSVVALSWVQDRIEAVEVKTIEELSYISNRDAEVASSIISLGWVQDGIDDAESGAIHWMRNIGAAEVASSVVALSWVQDRIEAVEVKTIEELSYISNRDAEVASSIISLGWVQDGIDDAESGAIHWMRNIGAAEVASSVVALSWVQDRIEAVEVKTIEELSYISNRDAEVASSIISLGWVQDGIDDAESGAIHWMRNIGAAEVASSVVALSWVQDRIEAVEVKTIEELSYISNRDAEVASSIISLGWVQDGIDDAESGAIHWMRNIGAAEVASSVVALSWVQDRIEAVEVKTIEELSYISNRDAEVASSIIALGWVQDGIADAESEAIQNLLYVAVVSRPVASSIIALGWVQDGIDDAEADLIEDFGSIVGKDAEAALRIVGMPFVETIEPPDISAMASLRQLAAFEPETFDSVMSHAALRDGISNDLAPVVATLKGVAGTNPGLIDVMLDPSKVFLEWRTITLPLAGEVVLYIIRTGPGAARSMDLLEHSVRGAEEFMGSPLPTSYVGLLYENAVAGSNAGTNFGTHIAVLPKFDVEDGSHEAEFAGSNIAHEVAHYYWSGNKDWVDEGAADFMASIIEGARTGRPIAVTNPPCGHADSIAELESLGISRGDIEFRCNYSLGERIFVDLNLTLGDERFRQRFRALYLASEIEDDADDLRGTSVGIDHIREAFRSDDEAESTVIARWYNGTEPYDLSRLDSGPVNPGLISINGRIDEAYIVTSTDGPAVSDFSAQDVTDWVHLTLKYSYKVSGATREVPLEIVEYYEDGFEFRRRSRTLTAEARYIGSTSWFSVGQSPSRKWAPGHYVVYVYAGERKVAEVEYEVTP